jgi:hypothetical protein
VLTAISEIDNGFRENLLGILQIPEGITKSLLPLGNSGSAFVKMQLHFTVSFWEYLKAGSILSLCKKIFS